MNNQCGRGHKQAVNLGLLGWEPVAALLQMHPLIVSLLLSKALGPHLF